MKQQLVSLARNCLRNIPLSMQHKQTIRHFFFSKFPSSFRHLPAYSLWRLEHPEISAEEFRKMDLPKKRSEALKTGAFDKNSNPSVLMVTHSLGGGTEHHVQQLGQKLTDERTNVWALRSLGHEWVRIVPYQSIEEEGLIFHIENEKDALIEQLKALNLSLIHVHHFVDFAPGFMQIVHDLATALKLPYDFTAHDYLSICPRFTLYDDVVRGYCGEPDVSRCSGCVKTYGSSAGKEVDVEQWRADYAQFLNGARHVYTPDMDVKTRLERYLPDATIINRPHWDEAPITPLKQNRKAGEPLRILTLGGIAPHKGSMVLKECAEDAKKRGLAIEFTLIGFSDIDWQLKKHIPVSGPYKAHELPDLLEQGQFDVIFLPAVWPETFNYTLSEALHYGLYPVCFDIGAIARRVKELGYGSVLPYKDYRYAGKINDALLAINLPDEIPVKKLESAQVNYKNILQDYYNLEIKAAT